MKLIVIGVVAWLMAAPLQERPSDDRLYGRVTTSAGRELEGYLRWDGNEGAWSDYLDGLKEIPWEHMRDLERLDEAYAQLRREERSIRAFGLRITWDEDDDADPVLVSTAVRFGYLRSIEALDDRRAELELNDGTRFQLRASSSDVGRGFRGLVVEGSDGRVEDLRWRDLERVVFLDPPADAAAPADARLYGTLTTRGDLTFTGHVSWDRDEILSSDELDGDDGSTDRAIPFARIAAIERESDRSARVVLIGGEEIVLRGTNDVNSDIRGIEVLDRALGRVTVQWQDFESVRFHPPAGEPSGIQSWGRVGPVSGEVVSDQGMELSGRIRWDNDEAWSWEIIDGTQDGIDFDIELGNVASIRKLSGAVSRVTLQDGRSFDLEGSNDVNDENRGVFVTGSAGTGLIKWREFERADFRR